MTTPTCAHPPEAVSAASSSASSPSTEWARSGRRLLGVGEALVGALRWLAEPQRLLTLAWLVGVLVVGTARLAHAQPIIVGPDLAHGGPKTLFESYDFITYKLTVQPDGDHTSDWFGLDEAVLQVVGFLNNVILWICLGLLYGALTMLEWLLNLTVYRDSGPQIDAATQMIAATVFWPLISATVAVGAFIAYARWRGEGRGFLSDLGWVVAAAGLAAGFAAGPSTIMNNVDGLRQDMAAGVIAGSAQFASVVNSPTGFPTPQIGGDPQNAGTRTLVDGVWQTFGASAWCFAEFRDLDVCKTAGAHALANDDQWQQWELALSRGDTVPEFGNNTDWIRGQDITRTGYVLLLALITIPLGIALVRLVGAGLIAVVGFLLMLVIGMALLTTWPIPGWFRQAGTRYWIWVLGLQLQALFITLLISGLMVVSTILSTQVGNYGYFIVALLNLALFFAAMRARAWLDMLTTVGGGGSLGFASVLLARAAVHTAAGGIGGVLGLGGRGAAAAGRATAAGARWGRRTLADARAARMSDLDPQGPIHATATRIRRPDGLTGPAATALPARSPAALPSGRPTGPGAAPSGPGGAGPGRPPRGPGSPGSPGRTPPLGTQGTGRPRGAGSRPDVVDGGLSSNVGRAGTRGRVWVDKRGEGLSALDNTPGPPLAGRRGNAYRITSARPPRRRRR